MLTNMFVFSEKGKKSKGTTLSLQEFNSLHEGNKASSGQNVVYVPKTKQMSSWADEVEEDGKFELRGNESVT